MQVICDKCQTRTDFQAQVYRCACGGAWEPLESSQFDTRQIDKDKSSIWRYQTLFGLPEMAAPMSLGAGWTPLLEADWQEARLHLYFKLEYMAPTGSFKDRGTELEANYLKAMGVSQVVEDSSGNAGASLAAYAARTGLQAAIYAPESASAAKLAQIRVFGAELRTIPGERIEATRAALRAAEAGAVYASHAYNPQYLLGQQTFAWEIWEQLGGAAPDAVVIPVGQGGLLMGAWLGFRRLLLAGLIERLPRLYAVQPRLLAPIAHSFARGDEEVTQASPQGKSLAEGLAIVQPVRGRRILQALRESGGAGLMVDEEQIRQAYQALARQGFFVEPSSAAAAASLTQVQGLAGKSGRVVVALTGSGLKSTLL